MPATPPYRRPVVPEISEQMSQVIKSIREAGNHQMKLPVSVLQLED